MIKISDRLTLMMVLDNDKEFPIERFVIKSLQISMNVMLHVPQFRMLFADREGILKKFPIGDSQVIRVIMKVDGNSQPAYNISMRVFKLSKITTGNVDYFDLLMTYNAPRFLYENLTGSISGASSAALARIAANCGMTSTFAAGATPGLSSVDNQVWIPSGEKYCNFARKIVTAGYMNNTSCMVMGVDIKGDIIYRDLSTPWYGKDKTKPVVFSTVTSTSPTNIKAYKEFTKSGIMNAFGGYRAVTVEQNPLKGKSSTQEQHSKVSTKTTTESVAVNKNINEGITGSRVQFAPINCGNNHDNYDKAKHQNSRLLGLYSVGMYVVTDTVNSDITLLQTVKVDAPEITNGERKYNKVIAGEWEISGKTLYLTEAGKYYEKYEFLRQGQNNMSGNATQAG